MLGSRDYLTEQTEKNVLKKFTKNWTFARSVIHIIDSIILYLTQVVKKKKALLSTNINSNVVNVTSGLSS